MYPFPRLLLDVAELQESLQESQVTASLVVCPLCSCHRLLLDVAELQESLESLGHMALQLRLLCRHAAGTLQVCQDLLSLGGRKISCPYSAV